MGDLVEFNGIDADTGGYLFPGRSLDELVAAVRSQDTASPFLRAMCYRHDLAEANYGVASFADDRDDLGQTGWGVLSAQDADPRVLDALRPLLDLRKSQAGSYYREFVVSPGDDASTFLRRHGMGPDPADPRKVPYYLLIVGPPTEVPFTFQYLLDVQYAVGRIDFDSVAEYEAYALAVCEAEARDSAKLPVHLFGTCNPGDRPTKLSSTQLLEPLARELIELAPGIQVTKDIGEQATKDRLSELISGGPAVLFTASHGLGRANGEARDIQGALVCQDWPGPLAANGILPGHYYSGTDVTGPVAPRVVFSFACYSAGFPTEPYVARLPQRLLAHGALAFVGHIDRAWGYSFLWSGSSAHITAMMSCVLAIHKGRRIGNAMEDLNIRWGTIAATLTVRLEELKERKNVDERELAWLWTASSDARNYVLLGDPAVRAG
ncbi:hypothetical protein JOF56_006951 [Kibdelosporangium banguiense]|uniref:CHAT domain-containing protein n=1 Tax=Kibdelosporangium banguiense TaxID=1365924 RepID=A0ABS4TQ75_9PSEU|nr:hypothetical protein [Kibdelosporangium banguiense]MBP2326566.1 hypothetical protein [Kibdelosporangium banguiense]